VDATVAIDEKQAIDGEVARYCWELQSEATQRPRNG
jgi:hypothetical protein